MRQRDDERATARRIKRLEDEANATILRSFERVIHGLERERTEWVIRQARRKKVKR